MSYTEFDFEYYRSCRLEHFYANDDYDDDYDRVFVFYFTPPPDVTTDKGVYKYYRSPQIQLNYKPYSIRGEIFERISYHGRPVKIDIDGRVREFRLEAIHKNLYPKNSCSIIYVSGWCSDDIYLECKLRGDGSIEYVWGVESGQHNLDDKVLNKLKKRLIAFVDFAEEEMRNILNATAETEIDQRYFEPVEDQDTVFDDSVYFIED